MATLTQDEISSLVEQQVRAILGDPGQRAQVLGTSLFGPDEQDMLAKHDSQLQSLLADNSLGRVLNGPLWLSGASVLDGTVTATKISVNTLEAVTTNTGSLNVTGSITAAAAFPATGARIVVNSSGLWGYSGLATTTFKLNSDGSGEIGSGTDKITWTTGGVVSVPKAIIGALTIADIGSGVMAGTYQTNSGTSRIDLSSTGIIAYATGTETFKLNGTTGAMTATGSFTIQSATTGTRVVISNAGGIEGYNGTTRTFFINAATGAGILGVTGGVGTNSIEWDQTGVKIGGVSLSSGKITASGLSVSNLAAISADLGSITAGTINASLITVSNLNAGHITGGGTLGSSVSLGTSDFTVNSTGKIKFGSSAADYLANDILHFEVGTGDTGKIEFKNGANSPYSHLFADASSTATGLSQESYYDTNTKTFVHTDAYTVAGTKYAEMWMAAFGSSSGSYSAQVFLDASSAGVSGSSITLTLNNNNVLVFNDTNRAATFYGYIYPGSGSGSQATRYIKDNGTQMELATSALRINLTRTGTAQNWPTGGSPTSVIMSTDAGATLLSIGCEYVTVNFNGTDRKVLCVA